MFLKEKRRSRILNVAFSSFIQRLGDYFTIHENLKVFYFDNL